MTQQQAREIVAETGIQAALRELSGASRQQSAKLRLNVHAAIMRAGRLRDTSRRDALPSALAEQVKAVMTAATAKIP